MSQHPQGFDPDEFHAQGVYLWRLIYPVLLVSFYLLILVGWIFLPLKRWLIILAAVYLLVGSSNFIFVDVPSTAVRGDHVTSGQFLHSILVSPILLLFFPVVHLFMIVRIVLMAIRASKRR